MHDRDKPTPDADPLAEIIRAAGNRRPPPRTHYDQVFAASHAAWRRSLRQRRRLRWLAAAAALLAITMTGAIVLAIRPGAPHEAATVAVARGAIVQQTGGSERWLALSPGMELASTATRIRTGSDGGGALAFANGGSLRLGPETELVLTRDSLALEAGLLYFDSWGRPEALALRITTPLGTVRDIGTQFELRADDNRLRIRVRTGAIELDAATGTDLIRLTDAELEVTADGEVRRRVIAPDDPAWAWAEALATAPDDGSHSVFEYLSWIAREQGKTLRFDPPTAELRARDDTYNGDPTGLTPLELLSTIAATTSFRYEVPDDGTILIRR